MMQNTNNTGQNQVRIAVAEIFLPIFPLAQTRSIMFGAPAEMKPRVSALKPSTFTNAERNKSE